MQRNGLYITAIPKYISFKKAAQKPFAKIEGLVEILVSSFWTYGTKDWSDKKAAVSKGEVFAVIGKYNVAGGVMWIVCFCKSHVRPLF